MPRIQNFRRLFEKNGEPILKKYTNIFENHYLFLLNSREYKHAFSFMLTLYGINVCYYFYIVSSHFSKNKHRKSDYNHFKIISATTIVVWATDEMTTATIKVISSTAKKKNLVTEEVITTTLKVILVTT